MTNRVPARQRAAAGSGSAFDTRRLLSTLVYRARLPVVNAGLGVRAAGRDTGSRGPGPAFGGPVLRRRRAPDLLHDECQVIVVGRLADHRDVVGALDEWELAADAVELRAVRADDLQCCFVDVEERDGALDGVFRQ